LKNLPLGNFLKL